MEFAFPRKTMTIASGAVSGTAIELEGWELQCLEVPALTSATLQLFGSVDGGATYRAFKDGIGNTLLLWPASTGNFIVAARDLVDIVGCTHIMPVAGAAQGGIKTLTLYGRPTT